MASSNLQTYIAEVWSQKLVKIEGPCGILRIREGMAVARPKGKLRGKQPKPSEKQQKELRRMHGTGEYSIHDLAELFAVSRPTIYRTLARTVTKVMP